MLVLMLRASDAYMIYVYKAEHKVDKCLDFAQTT